MLLKLREILGHKSLVADDHPKLGELGMITDRLIAVKITRVLPELFSKITLRVLLEKSAHYTTLYSGGVYPCSEMVVGNIKLAAGKTKVYLLYHDPSSTSSSSPDSSYRQSRELAPCGLIYCCLITEAALPVKKTCPTPIG